MPGKCCEMLWRQEVAVWTSSRLKINMSWLNINVNALDGLYSVRRARRR